MKIAFIMLCHKNPEQINMLLVKLSAFHDADIYIHVDMNHAEIRGSIINQENIKIVPKDKSLCIQWGSVDIVKATLQLIREVKESGKLYDYIWLVSGQDYPICPVKEIDKRLAAKPGTNYIETITYGDSRYKRYKKLYEIAYPSWINNNTIIVKSIKRLYMILTGGYYHTFRLFIRKKPFDFDFTFGSQWWTLTCEAAYEILEYSDQHPEVLNYFEKTIIPDECFFQTLFMNGSYKDNRAMNLTYINWGNNRRSPETLTMMDADKIKESSLSFCFARKFDSPQSLQLIDYINDSLASTFEDII